MFLHELRYELLVDLRAKGLLIWLILFPMILGTMFKAAFGSLYEKNDLFDTIPTAVVETSGSSIFREVADSVSEGDAPLLSVTYTDEDKALEMLKNGDVDGIIYAGEKVTLTVAHTGMRQTILEAFIEQYGVYEGLIREVIGKDPAGIPKAVAALTADVKSCTEIPATGGNTDPYIQYFYNLIAMVAMFGSVTGLHVAENNQANMTSLGARKNCSPTPKSVSLTASLTGSCMAQAVCMAVCVTFIAFVLRVDLGNRIPLVYCAAVTAGCMGVTMGFFIGSIGRLSGELKTGIAMTVSMLLCFMSGLMVGNMKAVVAEYFPWFNSVNPVALASDCFYCLNLYSDLDRFGVKIISMLIYIVVFTALGIILSRRKKYASI